jgi:hypothetical protein
MTIVSRSTPTQPHSQRRAAPRPPTPLALGTVIAVWVIGSASRPVKDCEGVQTST